MSKDNKQDNDFLEIAGHKFTSRLIIGTGKYKSFEENRQALESSGAEMITVALRRVNVLEPQKEKLQDVIDPKKYIFLPNTAGCYTADDAVRTLRLARQVGGWNLVKLEVIGNSDNLFPDMEETLKAAKTLIEDGFDVMVYSTDDPIYCQKLEKLGVCAIMPLAAPIGSGLGIQNKTNLRIIIENANIPVIVDAGVGTASDATIAMEMGCDAVLMNTAIAEAKNPILMAESMKLAVESGRKAYLAGRMAKRLYASASSPIEGLIEKAS